MIRWWRHRRHHYIDVGCGRCCRGGRVYYGMRVWR